MRGLPVYIKGGLPFAWELYLESSTDSYLYFWLVLLLSVSYFFFLYWLPSLSFPLSITLSLCMIFDTISFNIDKVLSINPSANVFVFWDFSVHYKDRGLTSPHRCCITSFSQLNRIPQSGQDTFFILYFLSHLKLLWCLWHFYYFKVTYM